MTTPAPVDPASITEDELAALRRLTTTDVARLTDDTARQLLATLRCPLRPGLPLEATDSGPDTYGAAAAWWEGLALLAELPAGEQEAGAAPILEATVGDVRVKYGEAAGGTDHGDPSRLWAVVRRLRRRSCTAGAKTVRLLPPDHGELGLAAARWDEYGDLLPAESSTLPAYGPGRTVTSDDPVVNA